MGIPISGRPFHIETEPRVVFATSITIWQTSRSGVSGHFALPECVSAGVSGRVSRGGPSSPVGLLLHGRRAILAQQAALLHGLRVEVRVPLQSGQIRPRLSQHWFADGQLSYEFLWWWRLRPQHGLHAWNGKGKVPLVIKLQDNTFSDIIIQSLKRNNTFLSF